MKDLPKCFIFFFSFIFHSSKLVLVERRGPRPPDAYRKRTAQLLALQASPLLVVAPGFVPALPDVFRLSRSVRCRSVRCKTNAKIVRKTRRVFSRGPLSAVSSLIFATEGPFFEIYQLCIFLHRSTTKQSPSISQVNTFDDLGNMLLV